MADAKMKTLAFADLDIEELERRLELAVADVTPMEWGGGCPRNCSTHCDDYCWTLARL